jgi:alpha-ketoglutarate-dependent 2,4-dichlorophenoxyacetate dioxygenase
MSVIDMIQSLPRAYPNTFPSAEQSHQPIQDGHITITPVLHDEHSSFGAQIDGIDWCQSLPAEDVAKVRSPSCPWASDVS